MFGHDTRASKGLRAEHPTFGNISSLMAVEMSGQMIQAQNQFFAENENDDGYWFTFLYLCLFVGNNAKTFQYLPPIQNPVPNRSIKILVPSTEA